MKEMRAQSSEERERGVLGVACMRMLMLQHLIFLKAVWLLVWLGLTQFRYGG